MITSSRFKGAVAVVTGGGRGLGAATALALASEGAAVAVVDSNGDSARQVTLEISRQGLRGMAVQADVSREEDVTSAFSHIGATLGPPSILINNAAIDEAVNFADLDLDRWNRMLAVNLTGVFLCCRTAVSYMREVGNGRIVNVGSQVALTGARELAHYCAAKAGVHGLTRALARDLAGDSITVNTVAPGPIDTEMLRGLPEEWRSRKLAEVPLGRFAAVHEIVPAILLLASSDGSYFTGSTVNVSGGDVMQ